MKQRNLFISLLTLFLFYGSACTNRGSSSNQPTEPWTTAILAYTFRNDSFLEAVDKASELGIGNIGGYPGQAIGGGIQGEMAHTMDENQRKKVLDHLESKNVKLVDFGVISPNSEKEWISVFEFAKAMGIANIVSEPDPDDLDLVSSLCDLYQVNVAIHNHAAPSHYWNPDSLMNQIKGKSERIGICADVGHWVRSGLDPVESLRKVRDRLKQLHFKDVSQVSLEAEDVVWGTGVSNVEAMLEELVDQEFSGIFSVEYERNPSDNMGEIEESLRFYEEVIQRQR